MVSAYPKEPAVALPTIGRVVYVYEDNKPDHPHAAIVADVVGGHTINVGVFAHSGDMLLGGAQNVPHIMDKRPDQHIWWDWMAYQKGQAAKTEELERTLEDKLGRTGPTTPVNERPKEDLPAARPSGQS